MPRMGLLPLLVASVHGLQLASLLDANRATVNALNPDVSELTRLRFAMAFPDDAAAASAALEEQLAWRAGEGASIVSAAASAVKAATADGGWNNQPVNDAAPHAALVNQYITTNQIVTLSTAEGDLVFCIRAAALDDASLMSAVTVEQLTDFFLYTKEIHSLVADARTERSGRLCRVLLANDLGGLNLAGDASFRSALSASSMAATRLYPSLAGPTLLLNLPFLLQTLVSLFKPLFPPAVLERLKFAKAEKLGLVADLATLTTDAGARDAVLGELEEIATK